MLKIYCDGSTKKNPGPGGYAAVVFDEDELIYTTYAYTDETTNNREEMKAILAAFKYLDENDFKGEIYSDSAYCVNMINDWIAGWKRNGWTRARGQEILNLDLVKEIHSFLEKPFFLAMHPVKKVKGHSGILGNELADALASNNQKKLEKIIKELKEKEVSLSSNEEFRKTP